MRRLLGLVCAMAAGAALLAGCANKSASYVTHETTPLATRGPDIPAGFKDAGNGLAWQWLDQSDPDFDCSYYDSCSMVKVYAYKSCPSLVYVSANILNSSGTVVDSTNDTLSSLDAGQTGLLRLGSSGGGNGNKTQLTELKCY